MSRNEPLDKELYNKLKNEIWEQYKKPSAYRSAQLVKKYKEAGGTYSGERDINQGISRWFREKWMSNKGTTNYPHNNSVYRPTIRITKDTPTTFAELTPAEIERAKKEKARTGRVKKIKLHENGLKK